MFALNRRKVVRMLAMTTLIGLAAACGDDSTEPEEDPAESIVTMRLVVGGKTIDVNQANGAVTNGPIIIGAGASPVTFSFLDASGAVVSGLDDFEVRATSDNTAAVTFASTGKFTGALTKVAAGSTQVRFGLWHVLEGHYDVGPFPVPVTIQ